MGYKFPHTYKRDVWLFGPSSRNGCVGSFPNGFIPRLKKNWWGQKRLWLCSGGFKDRAGTTLDIRPVVRPDVLADAQFLPFKNASFDFVMADPPYSDAEAKELYGLPKNPSTLKLINEGARVLKSGGYLITLHRIIPILEYRISPRLELVAIIGIGVVANWSNIRALTVFRKMNTLEDIGVTSPP